MDDYQPPRVGLFFEKRAQSSDGRFFRDLAGRDQGEFFKAAAAVEEGPAASANLNDVGVRPTTGDQTQAQTKSSEKVATPDPTFLWDEPIADGFHRPAREQAEALEYGGERFHASDADRSTGAAEEKKHSPAASSENHKGRQAHSASTKHASSLPRFLGTSFKKSAFDLPTGKDVGAAYDKAKSVGSRAAEAGKEYGTKALETGKEIGGKLLDRAAHYGGQAFDTLRASSDGLGDRANEVLDAASRHPLGAAAMLGGAGLVGAKAVGGAARGAASLLSRKKPVPKGLVARGLAGLSHLLHG